MFHLDSYSLVLENPMYNINRFVLQESGNLLGGLSDCEELVGVTHSRLKLLNCTEYQG